MKGHGTDGGRRVLRWFEQVKNKRKANLDASIDEVEQHIKLLTERYGTYEYPPARSAYHPHKEDEHLAQVYTLNLVLPSFFSIGHHTLSQPDFARLVT